MVPFASLSQSVMGLIVDKFTAQLATALKEKRVEMLLTEKGRAWLAEKGYDKAFGARPLARVMRESIEDELASEVLFGKLVGGGRVVIDADSPQAEKLLFTYGGTMLESGKTFQLEAGKPVKLLPAQTAGSGKQPRAAKNGGGKTAPGKTRKSPGGGGKKIAAAKKTPVPVS
jgi:ATP-dependent Clp protease ATP-binding subunit ClpA